MLKIPGTNQSGEAEQQLLSFDRAFRKVESVWPGGSYRMAVIAGGLAWVYDTGMDEVFAASFEIGKPPVLRWFSARRDKIGFIEEV